MASGREGNFHDGPAVIFFLNATGEEFTVSAGEKPGERAIPVLTEGEGAAKPGTPVVCLQELKQVIER